MKRRRKVRRGSQNNSFHIPLGGTEKVISDSEVRHFVDARIRTETQGRYFQFEKSDGARPILRCHACGLVQFSTPEGYCRKCGSSLNKTVSVPGHVPEFAEKLLILCSHRGDIDSILGDLEERFRLIVLPKCGPRLARLWYWKEAVISLWPLIWAAIRRVIAVDIVNKIRRYLG